MSTRQPIDIETFADMMNLSLEINSRPRKTDARYYAKFSCVEIMENGMLVGTYGDGRTPNEAVAAYAKQLSGKRIAVGAYTDNRREINVPELTYNP